MLFDLVFEGGGVRGVAFIGALEALVDNGHEVDRVMGTSVGGLTAALLATGHEPGRLRDVVFSPESGRLIVAELLKPHPAFTGEEIRNSETRKLLRDVDFPFVPDFIEGATDEVLAQVLMRQQNLQSVFSVVERMGMRRDADWLAWLGEVLNEHSSGEDWASMGLAALYRRTGRSLTLIGSNISTGTMLVLNHSTAPELPLKWAVRMTTSVPFLVAPVVWRAEWGMYRQRRIEGHYIADGGLLSQFPLELFLSNQQEIQEMMGERRAGNNVLGLLLDENVPVAGITPRVPALTQQMQSLPGLRLIQLLLNTLVSNSNGSAVSPVESHVIRLPVMGIDPYAFEAKLGDLMPAINTAYNMMQDLLHGWQENPETLLSTFAQQYVQVVAEKFIVSGDYYRIGDVVNSSGIAIGEGARASVSRASAQVDDDSGASSRERGESV